MNDQEARTLLETLLHRIAPQVDLAQLNPNALLQEEIDLDSMDFMTLVAALEDATGLDIPERDYPTIASIDGFVSYVVASSEARPPGA